MAKSKSVEGTRKSTTFVEPSTNNKFPIPKNILIKRAKPPFKSSSYYRQNDDDKILESLSTSTSSTDSESEPTSMLFSSTPDSDTELSAIIGWYL